MPIARSDAVGPAPDLVHVPRPSYRIDAIDRDDCPGGVVAFVDFWWFPELRPIDLDAMRLYVGGSNDTGRRVDIASFGSLGVHFVRSPLVRDDDGECSIGTRPVFVPDAILSDLVREVIAELARWDAKPQAEAGAAA